jgi:hypothetical protein
MVYALFMRKSRGRVRLETEIDFRMHEMLLYIADEWESGAFDWDYAAVADLIRAAYLRGYRDHMEDKGSLFTGSKSIFSS